MIGHDSVVKHFAVGECPISIHICSDTVVTWSLISSLEETRPIEFKHRFKQVITTVFEDLFYLIVTRILKETLIIQVAFV